MERIINNAVLGVTGAFLSSSCCLIQLVLNYFSFGCAGFSVLTPWRSVFLSLTFASLALQWKIRDHDRKLVLYTTAITLITFSSDILDYYNNRASLKNLNDNNNNDERNTMKIEVTGVPCAACRSRVHTTLDAISWIKSYEVTPEQNDYGTGKVFVKILLDSNTAPPQPQVKETIITSLTDAYFESVTVL
eukprot:TRINITY_DN3637_c0_g1_i1.p1 TRINITY_DN3637_c0_g1~~TRINITY_DN3637_c0_g1_i1.p1  ORF type:complete len:197 (+),score=37.88 TRINITY_DN3637_c0_g1_i1:22-591(+)